MFQLRTPLRKLVQWSCVFSRKEIIAGIFFHPKTFRVSWHVVGSGRSPESHSWWGLELEDGFIYSWNSKQPYFHGCWWNKQILCKDLEIIQQAMTTTCGWKKSGDFSYSVEVGSLSHYLLRVFLGPRRFLGSLPSTDLRHFLPGRHQIR